MLFIARDRGRDWLGGKNEDALGLSNALQEKSRECTEQSIAGRGCAGSRWSAHPALDLL